MLRVDRVKRLAAMRATDKINRGTGMVPRVRPEEGLKHGIGRRQRMAAYEIIDGVRPKVFDEVRWAFSQYACPLSLLVGVPPKS